jgi:hypothetical protein
LNVLQVQADARRLQALFFQRMGLQFPDVDFSPVRTKIAAVPLQPAPVPGSFKTESLESSEPARARGEAETPTTRWRSSRSFGQQGNEAADFEPKEKALHEEKKSKKKGKDVKKIGQPEIGDKVGEDKLGGGVMHPVDLVVLKKKRNGRERVAGKLPKSSLYNGSHIEEAYRAPSGNNLNSPGANSNRRASHPVARSSVEGRSGNEKAELPGGLQGSINVGKRTSKPKLKLSWVGSSERGPG